MFVPSLEGAINILAIRGIPITDSSVGLSIFNLPIPVQTKVWGSLDQLAVEGTLSLLSHMV